MHWLLVLSIALSLHTSGPPHARTAHPAAQSSATYHTRADLAFQTHLLTFWRGDAQYLREQSPDTGELTSYWSYAQALHLLADNVARTGSTQYAGLIESFFRGQDARGWPRDYYDDESWMALALVRAYDVTQDARYLQQAIVFHNHIQSHWDDTCCGDAPGGIWWDQWGTQKATASNAGPALLAAQLYQRTGVTAYLDAAHRVYDHWFQSMVDPVTYHVLDHIRADGTRVDWQYTYNEGLMIGAATELYQATGDQTYLSHAHGIATYLITHQTVMTPHGPVLTDGANETCLGDCEQFKGVAYRYLAQLYRLDPSHIEYYAVLQASADALWYDARNLATTTFATNWAGPALDTATQYRNSAALTALALFAQVMGDYPGCATCAVNRYEAENATLLHLGLEARYGGYTGWGYLAAWYGDGQAVDFQVTLPADGVYTLAFRYAAAGGDARRLLRVDGVDIAPGFTLPGTSAWETYATHRLTGFFPAGPHTISLVFDTANGSHNYLNLDSLTIEQHHIYLPLIFQNTGLL